MSFEQIRDKRTELFGNRAEVTHVLSDLAVAAGIRSYQDALPNMTQEDAQALIELVDEYNKIDYEKDAKNDAPEQKSVLSRINDLLGQIIERKS
jgi:hypothetical protein